MKKVEKFNALLKQAINDNEVILVETYLRFSKKILSISSDEDFDLHLINFMKELAIEATSLFENKNQKLGEQKFYCLSLLSYSFFNGTITVQLEGKKVTIKF